MAYETVKLGQVMQYLWVLRALFALKCLILRLFHKTTFTMGVTELKRKGRRNKAVANNRTAKIKNLLRKPEVRNVDVEAIKAQFEANKK